MLKSFISALSATTEEMSFSDRASLSGIVSLEGMVIIFVALTLLWIAIEVMHLMLHHKEKTEKATKAPKALQKKEDKSIPASPAPVAAPVKTPVAAPVAATNDAALIAAITAAISAAMAEEGYTGGFRVVSFKRVSPANRKNRF